MGVNMNSVHCTNCDSVHGPIAEDLLDGTYTEICTTCMYTFSYRVEDGEVKRWDPPKVTQQYKGSGEPGGK